MSRQYHSNSGGGSGLIGWVAILGGGYVLLRAMGIDPILLIESMFNPTTQVPTPITSGTTTNANNPINSTTPSTTVTNTVPVTTVAPNTKQLVQTAVVQSGIPITALQSVDVWNYFYSQIRGVAGPSPEALFPNNDRNRKYTLDEWWNAMAGSGFSGLGGGLGMVVVKSPYHQYNAPGRGYGLVALGSEMFSKHMS